MKKGYWVFDEKNREWVKVEGKKVTIPGFKGFHFFAHKSIEPCGRIVISEARTGAQVGSGETKDEAIVDAYRRLTPGAIEEVRQALRRCIARNGVSPKYQKDKRG